MTYRHTQAGYLHYAIYLTSALLVTGAWFSRNEPVPAMFLVVIGIVLLPFAWAFGSLTVEDEGDKLLICFGPMPLLRKRIAYQDITRVEPDRTRLIDGWGIHWIPGRGTTYNVWGFHCVKVTVGRRTIRIGSDDVENLVEFLRAKITQ